MAMVNVARGAGPAHRIGAIAPGMKADFVLHDRQCREGARLLIVVDRLAYSADGPGVLNLWVDGR